MRNWFKEEDILAVRFFFNLTEHGDFCLPSSGPTAFSGRKDNWGEYIDTRISCVPIGPPSFVYTFIYDTGKIQKNTL